jgi:hypothetical protein
VGGENRGNVNVSRPEDDETNARLPLVEVRHDSGLDVRVVLGSFSELRAFFN